MAKTLYSASMSLDGFIAGPNGDMSWLADHVRPGDAEPDQLVDELIESIGALLIGARTFRGDDPNKGTDAEGAFGGLWSGPQFVLTHHPPADPMPGFTFVDDLADGVAAARAAANGKYVNILGADVARQCLEAGLLDEILVIIVPVLLGDGVRLFDRAGGAHVRLDPLPPYPDVRQRLAPRPQHLTLMIDRSHVGQHAGRVAPVATGRSWSAAAQRRVSARLTEQERSGGRASATPH